MTTIIHGFDELRARAGSDLGTSEWLAVTQERVNQFADATDDHQWIHVDPERAKAGPFGGPIAHGYLTLSLVIPLFHDVFQVEGVGMGVNYGLNRVRFPAPVPVGSRIRLAARLDSVKDVAGGGVEVVLDFTVEIEDTVKPACVAQAVYRWYPPAPSAAG